MKTKSLQKIAFGVLCSALLCTGLQAQAQEYPKEIKAVADGQKGDISLSAYPLVKRSEVTIPVDIKGKRYDFVKDFKASDKGFKDVTALMQKAIDKISSKGGGTLYIPAGEYAVCNVILKSNVHLLVSPKATLKGYTAPDEIKSYSLFDAGREEYVENISIQGDGGKYTVIIPEFQPGIRFVSLKAVRRFLIADAEMHDRKTKFSCITMGPVDKTPKYAKEHFVGPTDGVVMNLDLYGGHYGYGVIQAQAAENVRFYNLYGEGGATLRLETGLTSMNNAQWGGVFDIVGKNIMCVRGNSALMVSPHSMHCGEVNISDVTAISAGFAARIDNGFISKKYEKSPDIIVGTFKGGSLKNVTSYYGTKSQLKTKHLGYLPSQLVHLVAPGDENGVCEPAPSACAIIFEPNYPFNLDRASIKTIGYEYAPAVQEEPHTLTAEAKKIVSEASKQKKIGQRKEKAAKRARMEAKRRNKQNKKNKK